MRSSPRSIKMAGQVETLISPMIAQYITPDKVGFCTVTAVEVSGDLQVADVFVRAINAPGGWAKELQKIAPKLAHELGKTLSLNQKLTIRFKPDKAVKLMETLHELGLK